MASEPMTQQDSALPQRPGPAAICGAKTRSGGRCRAIPIQPSGRCRLHGGASLRGLAAPAWKSGRHSAYLPTDLRARYLRARGDPELLSLKDDLSLVDARIGELLGRLTPEPRPLLDRVRAALAAYD